jgi:hypothetical protein
MVTTVTRGNTQPGFEDKVRHEVILRLDDSVASERVRELFERHQLSFVVDYIGGLHADRPVIMVQFDGVWSVVPIGRAEAIVSDLERAS